MHYATEISAQWWHYLRPLQGLILCCLIAASPLLQIRYQGFKGIVHIDTPDGYYMKTTATAAGVTVDVDTTDLLLRKSMLKVKNVTDNIFGLVDESRPYKIGFLNQQFVMLLSALGVSDEAFLDLQQQYFEELTDLCWDGAVAMKYLLNNQEVGIGKCMCS